MDINYELFDRDSSLKKQRELFVECFPENIGTEVVKDTHYNWKFNSFPDYVKSFEYIANSNGALVGYYAAIPYKYSIAGKQVTAGMVCDVMTGLAARGKGVFTKLGRFSIDNLKTKGVSFTTGYPIRPEVIPGHLKVGWDLPFELPMYGKFISLNSFLSSKKLSIITPIANIILGAFNAILSIGKARNNDVKVEVYKNDELKSIAGFSEFFNSLTNEIPNYLIKDINFLNWRLGAPKTEYKIIVIRIGSRIVGYSISRFVVMEKIPCLGVLDFVFLKGYENYSTVLLQENEKLAKKGNAELIVSMIGGKWAKRYKFLRNGYLKTPHKFSFIFNKLDDSLSKVQLSKEENWHLMWIDSDDL